jgi:hypothetical protein
MLTVVSAGGRQVLLDRAYLLRCNEKLIEIPDFARRIETIGNGLPSGMQHTRTRRAWIIRFSLPSFEVDAHTADANLELSWATPSSH